MNALELLNRDFLNVRSRLLDLAAALDRIERGSGSASIVGDPRLGKLRDATAILIDGRPDRAERVQMLFSLPYDPDWRKPV